jgi:3,4-dihydroxy 2-butanone 4-phosphate synthase/GTP cyclohydrolase II
MEQIDSLLAKATDHCREMGRPLVTLSYAQSLDGCITAKRGQSLAISGPQSLALTHQLRAAHDAILVGLGTVLADNPRLTVRLVDGNDPQPVVADSRLRFPLDANLLRNHPLSPWIATGLAAEQDRQRALEGAGARVLRLPLNTHGQVKLVALLECLAELGIDSLMVEGGARIITSFLRERLADLLVLTISPMLVGGLHAVDNLGETDPALFPRLSRARCERLGEDLVLWGELAWGEA